MATDYLFDIFNFSSPSSLSPIQRGFAPGFVDYKKGCTRLAVASDKAYQLLFHGRWFSLGIPASSTTKTGCHDIAEILLKVVLYSTWNHRVTDRHICTGYDRWQQCLRHGSITVGFSMVGGSLWVSQLLPPLKLVAMI
jgi:hypothetical protein